ncbi:type I DNA topoisomerase [Candidatus Peregrinibacteria bacterium]|nr:type I DNA topoisomerase [Candidatus Peregrinibacteria bacterium]
MKKNLVVVESPAKAKTISRFLGAGYKIMASMGHVRDLPKSKMGIDIERGFKPNYLISVDKKKVIKQIKDELKKADTLWIATDEDREGEAIGWHLISALDVDKFNVPVKRIVFHEITEKAIKDAMIHSRYIEENIVNAQQARRVLDRLVGYELSPLLWKKIRYGLSAGRVQSVAVRLVVEREREIEAFEPEEFWKIMGMFEKQDKTLKDAEKTFEAELQKYEDKKLKISNKIEAQKVLKDLEKADYKVAKVEKKEIKRNPAPPFITSTLQQEASRKLGFSVKKTMMIAQQLYEGIDVGSGEVGLITYMRTDSVNMANEALEAAKYIIEKEFGEKFSLDSPRRYKGKKGAQEAHEAIRPVNFRLKPKDVSLFLNKDQLRLYELVWKRAVASQMKEAILNKTAADIEAEKNGKSIGYIFRATGQTIKFPGFMEVYMEGKDHEEDKGLGDDEKILPELSEGETVDLDRLDSSQHFTKPPARYTEASLVKKLESEGIGRPSTYAPTISTIMARGYIEKEGKALKPTDLAMVVTDLLVKNFEKIVDYKFTAEMEDKLDKVEEGKEEWVPMVREFYEPFHKKIEEKEKVLKKEDIVNEESDEICEKCGSNMVIKLGRFGKFLSCSNYPECKNARPLKDNETREEVKESKVVAELKEKFKGKKCEKCGALMEVKVGRYGPFLGCSNYPECKNIKSIVVFSGVKCPKCKTGQLVERRTRKGGRIFWGCNKFPNCKFATWYKPVKIDKKTGKLMVENKEGKVVSFDEISKKKEK